MVQQQQLCENNHNCLLNLSFLTAGLSPISFNCRPIMWICKYSISNNSFVFHKITAIKTATKSMEIDESHILLIDEVYLYCRSDTAKISP